LFFTIFFRCSVLSIFIEQFIDLATFPKTGQFRLMLAHQLLFAAACFLRLADAAPKIVEYDWDIEEQQHAPDGFSRKMFLVNGQFPGPKIEVNHGDVVRVNVHNNLDEATSLHWHGMIQKGSPWMDGVPGMTNCPIAPHTSYTYEFNTVSSELRQCQIHL
jgi:FtsP/CotA-like multicopper oxidase with cupredoxin domain